MAPGRRPIGGPCVHVGAPLDQVANQLQRCGTIDTVGVLDAAGTNLDIANLHGEPQRRSAVGVLRIGVRTTIQQVSGKRDVFILNRHLQRRDAVGFGEFHIGILGDQRLHHVDASIARRVEQRSEAALRRCLRTVFRNPAANDAYAVRSPARTLPDAEPVSVRPWFAR